MRINEAYPKKIICLTEECTETLYLLNEGKRIIGVSNYAVRPKRAKKEKKIICSFINANIDKIISLKPDLVIGYSDIQANIAQKLIKHGITVWINNYRNINGIKIMINQLGLLVGKHVQSLKLVNDIESNIKKIKEISSHMSIKPKVYFEEWFDPLITSIQWVSEIIELCGGKNIVNAKNSKSLANDRIIKNHKDVIKFNPDIILVSWCGKKFKKNKMINREGWKTINAVKYNHIYEINSSIILQPGPAALTDGINIINSIINDWYKKNQ
ncbi:MAG: cobalamin-binding protein [Flavobacteriales bacterium]|nr:cobalamin-binding protein [Flavobacteriales bacterium]|tara:strand:- start:8769 stop:9578 length:810 start_codon:yes stop_codon:yes gene_type:complete